MFTPVHTILGTATRNGTDYQVETLSYGSRHTVIIARKGALHRHGMTFTGQAAYEAWKETLVSVMQEKHKVA